MMTTTHAFVGGLVGATTIAFAPELTPTALVVGLVGGALPDVDLVATHRRSCHFPVYASLLAIPVTIAALVLATPAAILLAVFVVSLTLHCLMDVFGGGVEPRPWEATSDQGVYDHYGGRWIAPRRWVRWAGAPEDLLVAFVVGVPVLAVASGRLHTVLVAVLVLSAVFTLLRRRLTTLSRRIVADGGSER